MLVSLGAFLPGLIGKTVSTKLAKGLGVVMLIVLALAVLSLGKYAYDKSLIADHESDARARRAEATLRADRKADEAVANQAAELVETQQALEQAQQVVEREQPVEAAKTVGPATQSYYDTLRKENAR